MENRTKPVVVVPVSRFVPVPVGATEVIGIIVVPTTTAQSDEITPS